MVTAFMILLRLGLVAACVFIYVVFGWLGLVVAMCIGSIIRNLFSDASNRTDNINSAIVLLLMIAMGFVGFIFGGWLGSVVAVITVGGIITIIDES